MSAFHFIQKLRRYLPIDASDEQCYRRFLAFAEREPACFERSCVAGHITGSAWLLNTAWTHVLLTHHRKLGRWLQLGGHADGDSDVLEVALREAREESGITAIAPISGEILDLDIHTIPAHGTDPEHLHYDVRFALEVTDATEFIVSDESLNLKWIAIEDLGSVGANASILRMAKKWSLTAESIRPRG